MIADALVEALTIAAEGGRRISCALAGESGAGKTILARYLLGRLNARGIGATVLHQDDYFRLPPRANHQRRIQDFTWVGPQEVELDRLEQHVLSFHAGADAITVPRVSRVEDAFVEESHNLGQLLIVEGTYVLRLESVELRIFIDRDYRKTEAGRRRRGRDTFDEHTDRILDIEHRLIAADRPLADALVGDDAIEELERASFSRLV